MRFKRFAIIAMIMIFITACSDTGPQLLAFIGNESTDIDFEGKTFRVYHEANKDLRYTGDSNVAVNHRQELLLNRLDSIEKEYGCTIETHSGDPDKFPMSYISGIPFADFVYFRLKDSYSMYLADYFLPLNEIPTIDLSSGKYGSESLLETLTWNGDTVGFNAAHWGRDLINFSNAIVYNPEIFAQINQPTPNEFYEQGKWNWEALRTIGNSCAAISTADLPVYLAPANDYFFRMLLLSNGGEYIMHGEDGKYEYGLLEPRVIDALQFGNDIYNEGLLEKNTGDYAKIVDKFSRNMYALMCEYGGYGIEDLISTNSDDLAGEMQAVGYCYMPDGPQATDNTVGVISNETLFYHVTREKEEDVEQLGLFMESLFASLDEDQ